MDREGASTPAGGGLSSSTNRVQTTIEKTYFEKQRDALVAEIAVSLEHVLSNINTLNRSLEGVIVVGKEFESVSTLWSTFYDDMAHDNPEDENDDHDESILDDQNEDSRNNL
ncbi:DASH complex subunit Dad1-domain-containing protein [Lipomyces arxii]|uniref:DASH complex subunit Dad1-domain-containing protein n=1 Tax=Lipomyces arxii TaxID=56418 RepID=UPI0034CD55D8